MRSYELQNIDQTENVMGSVCIHIDTHEGSILGRWNTMCTDFIVKRPWDIQDINRILL